MPVRVQSSDTLESEKKNHNEIRKRKGEEETSQGSEPRVPTLVRERG